MTKRFKEWYEKFPEFMDPDINGILNDAIRCYNFDIARPALMLSYIAFMFAVKKNIIESNKPFGYEDKDWEKLKETLMKDDAKAEEVFIKCVRQETLYGDGKTMVKAAIFDIPLSLRNQVIYWKDRRNDCAHYKDNEISTSHVSAFWQFMMSNYISFFPDGSIQNSINDYVEYFDVTLTPEGEDDSAIFKRLISVVRDTDDLDMLFKGLRQGHVSYTKSYKLLFQLFHNSNQRIHDIVKTYFDNNTSIADSFVNLYNSEIGAVFGDKPTKIHQMWYTDSEHQLYACMLEQGLIPDNQIEQSIKLKLERWEYRNSSPHLSNHEREIFERNGLFDYFIRIYYGDANLSNNYEYVNNHKDFYGDFLAYCKMDDNLVKRLVEGFSQSNTPWYLKSRLHDKLDRGDLDKVYYLDAVSRLGLTDPFFPA